MPRKSPDFLTTARRLKALQLKAIEKLGKIGEKSARPTTKASPALKKPVKLKLKPLPKKKPAARPPARPKLKIKPAHKPAVKPAGRRSPAAKTKAGTSRRPIMRHFFR